MSRRRKDDKLSTTDSRKADDLTVIEGIGDARQRSLRDLLGVREYRDLAALSAEEVESRLKAEGQVASRTAIDAWITRAHELAAAAGRPLPAQTSEVLHEERADSEESQPDWLPFASFVVEFQSQERGGREAPEPPVVCRTAVHHMEADEDEAWGGIEGRRLSEWMVERADRELQMKRRAAVSIERGEQPAETASMVEPPAGVAITEIRLFQRPEIQAPRSISVLGRPFSGSLKADEPFASEVSLALAGTTVSGAAARGGKYRVQVYAESLSTAAQIHLGDAMPTSVVADQRSYSAVLPECMLSAGVYRLRVLARGEGDEVVPEHVEAPLLRVID
jgi:hypothetical protein